MTRYYYTDPLAAAWMVKHFGMKYQTYDYTDNNLHNMMEPIFWGEELYHNANEEGKYYIHPESLHVLEPQIGYIVLWYGLLLKIYDKNGELVLCENTRSCGGYRPMNPQNVRYMIEKIVQRNGIAFMWPEVEE